MDPIDIDEILEIEYLEDPPACVEVTFKDGTVRRFNGSRHPEIFEMLNHWSPPTA